MDNTSLYVLVRDGPSSLWQDRIKNLHGDDANHHHNWYLIEDDSPQGALSPITSMAHKFPYHPMPTCLGSTIFILGGRNFGLETNSSDIWYFDINDDHGGNAKSAWLKGPSMHHGRSESFVIAAEGKVYVFGGTLYENKIWGEVYDMESQEWSLLIPPNDLLLPPTVGAGVVLNLDNNVDVDGDACKKKKVKKCVILLYLPKLGCLLSYQLATQNWELFDSYFGSQWAGAFVVSSSNNILLAMNYEDNLIYGYHIMRKEWFPEPISGLEGISGCEAMRDRCSSYIQLLSLGSSGKLCLFWSSRPNRFSPISVCCTQFTVDEIQDPESLVAKVETTREFTIDSTGDLCYCVAVLSGRKAA